MLPVILRRPRRSVAQCRLCRVAGHYWKNTSGLLALLNAKDENHARAAHAFAGLRDRQAPLVATSYVLVETYALVGRRLGLDVVRSFRTDFAPLIDVVWVDQTLHDAGLDLMLDRRKRQLSVVDAVSFVAMRQKGLAEAFAYDPHFAPGGILPRGLMPRASAPVAKSGCAQSALWAKFQR